MAAQPPEGARPFRALMVAATVALLFFALAGGVQAVLPPGFPGGGAATPAQTTPRRWAGLDTTGRESRNSTRLLDLLAAFDQIKVAVDDQIAIIYELRKTGALHAEIISE